MVETEPRLVEKKKDLEENLKKQNKKGTIATVQGNEAEETVHVIQSPKKRPGKGKGRQG